MYLHHGILLPTHWCSQLHQGCVRMILRRHGRLEPIASTTVLPTWVWALDRCHPNYIALSRTLPSLVWLWSFLRRRGGCEHVLLSKSSMLLQSPTLFHSMINSVLDTIASHGMYNILNGISHGYNQVFVTPKTLVNDCVHQRMGSVGGSWCLACGPIWSCSKDDHGDFLIFRPCIDASIRGIWNDAGSFMPLHAYTTKGHMTCLSLEFILTNAYLRCLMEFAWTYK
mgnify:CR=1 FL=1